MIFDWIKAPNNNFLAFSMILIAFVLQIINQRWRTFCAAEFKRRVSLSFHSNGRQLNLCKTFLFYLLGQIFTNRTYTESNENGLPSLKMERNMQRNIVNLLFDLGSAFGSLLFRFRMVLFSFYLGSAFGFLFV